jgi:hypothetical protein
LQYVFWKRVRALRVFSSRRIYRRKGDVRGWSRCPHHLVARPGGGTLWHGCPLPPLHLCFGLCLMSGKIGTLAFVSSNSENISCVTFLKHKNSRKQGTGTVALLVFCWRLVDVGASYSSLFPGNGARKTCCWCGDGV